MLRRLWFWGQSSAAILLVFLSWTGILSLFTCFITLTTTSAFAQTVQVYTDRSIVPEGDSVRLVFEVQGSVSPSAPVELFMYVSNRPGRESRFINSEEFSFQSVDGLSIETIPNINNAVNVQLTNERSFLSLSVIDNETPAPKSSCLLYTSPSPRDRQKSRMPSSA